MLAPHQIGGLKVRKNARIRDCGILAPIQGAGFLMNKPRAAFVTSLPLGFVVSALQAAELPATDRNQGDANIPKFRLSQCHS